MDFKYRGQTKILEFEDKGTAAGRLENIVANSIDAASYTTSNFGNPFYVFVHDKNTNSYLAGELYVGDISYEEQQKRQAFDFSRNAEPKRVFVHFSADDAGAYGMTVLGSSNMTLSTFLQYESMAKRKETPVHEATHTPDERETRYNVAEMLKFEPVMPQYKFVFRPGV